MTGFLHEKEFSRKSFIKGGGALVVGFSLLGSRSGRTKRRTRTRLQRGAAAGAARLYEVVRVPAAVVDLSR